MVVLGFDFGLKHIGVAIGQSITGSSTPLSTLRAQDGIPDWEAIHRLIQAWSPQHLVVGLPLHMDGTEQFLTLASKRFMNRLKQNFKLPVHAVDERLSSWQAKTLLASQTSMYKKRSALKVHAYAAALLVEQWLADETKPPAV